MVQEDVKKGELTGPGDGLDIPRKGEGIVKGDFQGSAVGSSVEEKLPCVEMGMPEKDWFVGALEDREEIISLHLDMLRQRGLSV